MSENREPLSDLSERPGCYCASAGLGFSCDASAGEFCKRVEACGDPRCPDEANGQPCKLQRAAEPTTERWSSAPYRAVTTETTRPPLLGDAMEAWKARGRELNEIYDVLTAVVEESAPGMDSVADLKALGAQRDRLRAENEALLEALRDLTEKLAGVKVGGFAARTYALHETWRRACDLIGVAESRRSIDETNAPKET